MLKHMTATFVASGDFSMYNAVIVGLCISVSIGSLTDVPAKFMFPGTSAFDLVCCNKSLAHAEKPVRYGDVVVFEYGRLTNTVDRCNDGMISFSQWPLEKIDVIAPLHV